MNYLDYKKEKNDWVELNYSAVAMTGNLTGLLEQNGQNGGSWFVNMCIVSLQSFTPNTQFVPQKGKITT